MACAASRLAVYLERSRIWITRAIMAACACGRRSFAARTIVLGTAVKPFGFDGTASPVRGLPVAKKNVTLNYIGSSRNRDATLFVEGPVPGDIPPNRQAIRRLSMHPGRFSTDWNLFAEMLSGLLPSARLFLDSSFLGRREVPREVWDAILARQVVITPNVLEELKPWIATPFANTWFHSRLTKALEHGSPQIEFIEPKKWAKEVRTSASHYIELLLTRKLVGHSETAHFETEHQRLPSQPELMAILHAKVRERGIVLAQKGLNDIDKRTFFADEEVVVLATFDALSVTAK